MLYLRTVRFEKTTFYSAQNDVFRPAKRRITLFVILSVAKDLKT